MMKFALILFLLSFCLFEVTFGEPCVAAGLPCGGRGYGVCCNSIGEGRFIRCRKYMGQKMYLNYCLNWNYEGHPLWPPVGSRAGEDLQDVERNDMTYGNQRKSLKKNRPICKKVQRRQ